MSKQINPESHRAHCNNQCDPGMSSYDRIPPVVELYNPDTKAEADCRYSWPQLPSVYPGSMLDLDAPPNYVHESPKESSLIEQMTIHFQELT